MVSHLRRCVNGRICTDAFTDCAGSGSKGGNPKNNAQPGVRSPHKKTTLSNAKKAEHNERLRHLSGQDTEGVWDYDVQYLAVFARKAYAQHTGANPWSHFDPKFSIT